MLLLAACCASMPSRELACVPLSLPPPILQTRLLLAIGQCSPASRTGCCRHHGLCCRFIWDWRDNLERCIDRCLCRPCCNPPSRRPSWYLQIFAVLCLRLCYLLAAVPSVLRLLHAASLLELLRGRPVCCAPVLSSDPEHSPSVELNSLACAVASPGLLISSTGGATTGYVRLSLNCLLCYLGRSSLVWAAARCQLIFAAVCDL